MDSDIIIKKKLIGGFDRKQVIDYINNLQTECSNRHTKDELVEMRRLIAELTCILEERNAKVQNLKETVIKLNSGLTQNNPSSFGFINSIEEIDAAKSMAKSISDTLEKCAENSDEDIAPLLERLSEINNEFDQISNICQNRPSAEPLHAHENDEKLNYKEIIEEYNKYAENPTDEHKQPTDNQEVVSAPEKSEQTNNYYSLHNEGKEEEKDTPMEKSDDDNPPDVYFKLDY